MFECGSVVIIRVFLVYGWRPWDWIEPGEQLEEQVVLRTFR
jgi:hypothetical protein